LLPLTPTLSGCCIDDIIQLLLVDLSPASQALQSVGVSTVSFPSNGIPTGHDIRDATAVKGIHFANGTRDVCIALILHILKPFQESFGETHSARSSSAKFTQEASSDHVLDDED